MRGDRDHWNQTSIEVQKPSNRPTIEIRHFKIDQNHIEQRVLPTEVSRHQGRSLTGRGDQCTSSFKHRRVHPKRLFTIIDQKNSDTLEGLLNGRGVTRSIREGEAKDGPPVWSSCEVEFGADRTGEIATQGQTESHSADGGSSGVIGLNVGIEDAVGIGWSNARTAVLDFKGEST